MATIILWVCLVGLDMGLGGLDHLPSHNHRKEMPERVNLRLRRKTTGSETRWLHPAAVPPRPWVPINRGAIFHLIHCFPSFFQRGRLHRSSVRCDGGAECRHRGRVNLRKITQRGSMTSFYMIMIIRWSQGQKSGQERAYLQS